MYVDTVSGSCFLNTLSEFYDHPFVLTDYLKGDLSNGAGWTVVGFIDRRYCQIAYKALAQEYPILFQSEVRRSNRTNNQCFFVVYDTRRK